MLPTTNVTRAPSYVDGDNKEYEVTDGTILIFKESGSDYVFIESSPLTLNFTASQESGITTESSATAKLNNVTQASTGDYYALVLLNNGSGKVTLPTGGKYSDWNNKVLDPKVTDFTGSNKDNFLMSNAALKASDGIKEGVLVKIDKTKIAGTKEAATTAAATIYVERAVAKVTVKTNETDNIVEVTGHDNESVEFINWALDVTNKKTYAVQNISGLADAIWGYTNQNGENYTVGYQDRLFWAIDPNYNDNTLYSTGEDGETARKANFNYITNTDDIKNEMGSNDYCLENTFNLDNMKQGQTTRVVLKANYKVNGSAATFYMVGKNTEMLSENDLKNKIQGVAQIAYNATGATSATITIDLGDISKTASSTHKIAASNIKVGDNALDANTTYGSGANAKTGTQIVQEVNTNLGITDEIGISTYLNGVTYYIARIKHFGDENTPWTSGEVTYGTDDSKYLGRYGVLRNNWYELTVNTVSGPGYPTVPPVKPDDPDDESDNYIKYDIKILDWAKRTQNLDL